MRAGPNGMNLAVVRQAAAGLMAWLDRAGRDRTGGDRLRRPARVPRASPRRPPGWPPGPAGAALLLPRALPTPVLAYAVRALGACAGVMVTASHNPPQDNGYKVYLGAGLGGVGGAGAQIVPPADAGIEAAIRAVGPLSRGTAWASRATLLDESIVESYVDGVVAVLREPPTTRSCGSRTRRCTGSARRYWRRCSPGRVRPAGQRGPTARPRPGLPHGRVPEPGGAGRDGPAAGAGRRRAAPTSRSPTTRTPTGAR